MNHTIIDISYLAHWRGKLTGIPRVINEIAARYNGQDGSVFVIWDDRANCFFEADLHQTLQSRGEKIHYITRAGGLYPALDKVVRYVGVGVFASIAKRAGRKLHLPFLTAISKWLMVIRFVAKVKFHPKRDDVFVITMGLWHSTEYIDAIKDMSEKSVKLAQISYDMLPITTPQYSSHSTKSMLKYNKAIFPIVDVILAISEYTRKDIRAWMESQHLPIPDIEVFRLGDDFEVLHQKQATKKLQLIPHIEKGKYILCVGTIELRKNHAILYYVYKLAVERGITLPKLIVVGRKGWQGEGAYDLMSKDPEVNQTIGVITDATDRELAWLYSNAAFTVYPSFYEGWGLPIAESIAYGIPCIASNTTSMPEIAGDLIEYFNPNSAEEILNKIQYMQESQHLADAKEKISHYKPTSWDQTFSQVARIVEGLHENS